MVVFKSAAEIEQLIGAAALECSELWVGDRIFKSLAGHLTTYPTSLCLMVNPTPIRFASVKVVCDPLLDLCDPAYQVVR